MAEASDLARRRRTFGPVVLLGLATAGLAAVASAKPWIGGSSATGADASMAAVDTGVRYPLASALSLVLLAAWGVLLVTRGIVRRAFAVLAALVSVGLVAAVVTAYLTLPDQARDATTAAFDRGTGDDSFGGWFWTTAVVAVVGLVPAVLAVRLVPAWPEMGTRYDAPGAGAAPAAAPETEQELWKALDQGQDPTDTARP